MGIKLAKDFVAEKNEPKNTKISRIPQGVEDATFKSFFDGFYPMLKEDYGKDKGLDMTTHENQDVSALATKYNKAAQLTMEKLGANFTKTVYWLDDNFATPVKIEDPEEDGKFFAESCYLIDIQSDTHRY